MIGSIQHTNMEMIVEVSIVCFTVLLCYVYSIHYQEAAKKKQSTLEKARNTREKNKNLRNDTDRENMKRVEFVNYVKDMMKSPMLNDDAKVGLVLNALVAFYKEDDELIEAAAAWKQALSKNKRKTNDVIQSVSQHEACEASVELPTELQNIPNKSRSPSSSPTRNMKTSDIVEAENRAKEWKGRSKSPVRRAVSSRERPLTFQEQILQSANKITSKKNK